MHNYGNEGEKSPFLTSQKPVRLTPSWEAQKLPNDELNFKGLTMEKATMSLQPPNDKWKIVFLIFVLHGLGTLTPWNMFITAKSYFVDFKLDVNTTDSSQYASNFLQYIGFAAQIPNLIFNWLNIFVQLGGDLTKRIVYSILLEIIIFAVTVVLAMLDSSSWPGTFFWITMISVVLLNMASGIYQNTIYGMAATLPIKYTGAVVLGSNMSGLFVSIMSICSSYLFSSQRTSAIYYFITALLVLLVCFDTYFALPLNITFMFGTVISIVLPNYEENFLKNITSGTKLNYKFQYFIDRVKFYRYHQMLRQKNEEEETSEITTLTVPYWTVFKEASPQLFNVFFTFFVTLAVFPAVHSDIKPVGDNFIISEPEFFTQITCFLTFNLFAMLGSLTTSWLQWPKPKYLVIPVTLRIIFLPLFLFCNYLPKNIHRTLPVLINNAWVYWIIAITMSFSSGYLSSLGMMYTPQTVVPKYQITAGMFAAAILITGIFSGILFSFIFPLLVTF